MTFLASLLNLAILSNLSLSAFTVSQILAGIAFLPALMSFQFKKREHILLLLVCSASLMSIHFFLLDQITASLIALLGAGRMFLARKFALEKMMLIFLLLNMIVLFITYQQPVNLLAFLATTCFTYANFRKDDKSLRLLMMLGTTVWIIHNALVGSPVAVLVEASFLTGNIVGYYRHYFRKK